MAHFSLVVIFSFLLRPKLNFYCLFRKLYKISIIFTIKGCLGRFHETFFYQAKISFLVLNEPGFGAEINPVMALTPFTSSIV